MTAGVICDLHMGDSVGVSIERLIEVVAVVGEVEQVAQEADVAHSAVCHHPVEHGHHIGGSA